MLQTSTPSQGHVAFLALDGDEHGPVSKRQHVKFFIRMTVPLNETVKVSTLSLRVILKRKNLSKGRKTLVCFSRCSFTFYSMLFAP